MNGKGSKPRPIVNRSQFEDNWDRIFGKKQFEEIHVRPKETDDLQVPTDKVQHTV